MSRDPRQVRFLTVASLRWVVAHHAWTPYYLVRYWRFFVWRLRRPDVVTEGFVFLGKDVELSARRGHGRLVVGRWVHACDGVKVRAHSGHVRLGEKVVLGREATINGYLDIEVGAASLLADWVYVTDFDHAFADVRRRIKDQALVTSPVRIGPDVWLGTKVTVVRGVQIGQGSVVAANAVVSRDLPAWSVAAGVPARVLRNRQDDYAAQDAQRLALADMARKAREEGEAAGQSATGSSSSSRLPNGSAT